jgi:polyadenylate-binding protein
MRHADSADASPPEVIDHGRPITPAGAAAAASVARALAARGWLPDLVVASDSVRTRETLAAMVGAVPAVGAARARFAGRLYTAAAADGATAAALAAELEAAGADDGDGGGAAARTVLAVGHNRGWEEAASALAGRAVRLETATAALFEAAAAGDGGWPAAVAGGDGWEFVGVVSAN